jgi:hypothetical protein
MRLHLFNLTFPSSIMEKWKKYVKYLLLVFFVASGPKVFAMNVIENIPFLVHASSTDWYLDDSEWNAVYPNPPACNPNTGVSAFAGFGTTTETIMITPYILTGVSNCNQFTNSSSVYNPVWPSYFSNVGTTTPAGFYHMNVILNCINWNNVGDHFECTSQDAHIYTSLFYWDGINVVNTSNSLTRIVSVTPKDKETVATSTSGAIGASIFVSLKDFSPSDYVYVRFRKNSDTQIAVANTSLFDKTLIFQIASSGDATFSTTTPLTEIGKYTMSVQIRKQSTIYNIFDFFGLSGLLGDYSVLVSTTTSFYVSTSTIYDRFVDTYSGRVSDALSSTTLDACSWPPNIYGCVHGLALVFFIPTDEDYASDYQTIRDDIFSRVPFGYIKRFSDIISATSSQPLPAINYTFSTSTGSILQPILGGENIHLDPFAYATGSVLADIKSDGANGLPKLSVWDILSPIITTGIYLTLAFMIVHDLTGVLKHGSGQEEVKKQAQFKV